MKKLLLAAAVAAAMTAPVAALADTTLYGNFRWTLGSFEEGGADATVKAVNNASRLGVKGSVGAKDGLKGFYHLQMGANPDGNGATGGGGGTTALSDRFYFAGVQGGFGKVLLGRASSPYKMAGLKLDPFYDTSAGPSNGGSNYGFSTLTNGFLNNVVAYITPKIAGGLTFNAVAVIDDGPDDEHMFNVGGAWSTGGITVGVQAITAEPAVFGIDSAIRLHAGYKTKSFSIGVNAENLDNGTVDGDFVNVSGTVGLGAKTKLAASFGQVSGDLGGARNAEGTGFSVGLFHKLAKKTEARLIVSSVDYDAAALNDRDAVGIMLIQSF